MIDLHMHSRYSEDGEFTPLELVEQCAKAGVHMMSVTDHNCVKANEEAQEAAKERGILYIPGIEIDCTYENVNFHVLGYGIDFRSSDFAAMEKHIDDQNFHASLERLAETQALGFYHITENDMWTLSKNNYWRESWSGELFAEVLLAMPEYADHPLLKPYRPGGERSDNPYVNFYWDYYSQGKPCYAKIDYPAMEETIDIIHRNHGAAVLARFYEAAQKNHLLVTCGSDYHGKTKPSVAIGQHNCPISYPEMKAKSDVFCETVSGKTS